MSQPKNDKPAFNLYGPIPGIENPLCGAVFSSTTLQPILQAPDPKWNDLLGNPGLDQDCLQSCRDPDDCLLFGCAQHPRRPNSERLPQYRCYPPSSYVAPDHDPA